MTKPKLAKNKKKATAKPKKASVEQRLQNIEARLTAAERALEWQPAQPPGHEPAPIPEAPPATPTAA